MARYISALPYLLSVSAVLFGVPTAAVAQERAPLFGVVVDSAGAPIPQVDVAIAALRKLTKTDDSGRFRFGVLPAGEIVLSIRRLGFEPLSFTHRLQPGASDTLRISLNPKAVTLEGIKVTERDMRRMFWIEDFYRRRARGIGTYITREDVEARRALRLSDVFRDTPGIRFVRVQGGSGIRFTSSPIHRRDCVPMIWLDGQRAAGMEIDELQVNEIEGIELYHGPSTTPMQFSQGSLTTCGTIVIWSRVPGT